ncbi:MAG: hypothetical protein ACRC1W_10680, partial [Shewanella sp.]
WPFIHIHVFAPFARPYAADATAEPSWMSPWSVTGMASLVSSLVSCLFGVVEPSRVMFSQYGKTFIGKECGQAPLEDPSP